jgi:hypothetical protein
MKAEKPRKKTRSSARAKTNSKKQSAASPKPAAEIAKQESVPSLNLAELLKDQPVYVNSIAAGLLGFEQGSVLRELQKARQGIIRFYMSESGGNHPADEAVKLVNEYDNAESAERNLRHVLSESVDQVSWYGLERLYNKLPQLAKQIWQLIQIEARKELESGNRMAATLETLEWQRDAWHRAQFLAIRNGFVADWKPKGAIELSMIDMLAQAFSEYMFWSKEVHTRSTSDAKLLYSREEERRIEQARGHWLPPRVCEQDAVEHAMQMMDRYNRLYLRTLRQLRDLRRYSTPVTINNPQQVNIATEGGQQVNALNVESSRA